MIIWVANTSGISIFFHTLTLTDLHYAGHKKETELRLTGHIESKWDCGS